MYVFSFGLGEIAVGETLRYDAQVLSQTSPTNSTTQDVTSQATWSTSDATVATVDKGGVVTSVATGSATITASFDGHVATAPVEVNQKATTITVTVSSFTLDTLRMSQYQNSSAEFTAAATYPDGVKLDATDYAAWTADPSGILKFWADYTYGGGVATLVAPGKTTVTAKLKTGEAGSLVVNVIP